MSDRFICVEEADKWYRLSQHWRAASEALDKIRLELLIDLNYTEGRALDEVEQAIEAVNGNAYMFAPQPEWVGGDSSDPKNHKWRPPHICSSPRIKGSFNDDVTEQARKDVMLGDTE